MWFQDYRIVVDGDEYFQDKNKSPRQRLRHRRVRIGQSIVYNRDWIGTFEIEFDMGQTFSIKDATIGSMHFDTPCSASARTKWHGHGRAAFRPVPELHRARRRHRLLEAGRQMGATINKWATTGSMRPASTPSRPRSSTATAFPRRPPMRPLLIRAVLNDRNLIHFGVAATGRSQGRQLHRPRHNDTYSFSEVTRPRWTRKMWSHPKITYTSYDNCWTASSPSAPAAFMAS